MGALNTLISGLGNLKTTGAGVAGGVAIAGFVATSIPDGPVQQLGYLIAVIVAAIGILAKDSTTGSQPNP